MKDLETLTTTAQDLLGDLEAAFDGASTEQFVEFGVALFNLIKDAESIQDRIKMILREAALEELGHSSGIAKLDGIAGGSATITVPKAKPRLRKDADIELLKKVLGDDFDLYLETSTSHKIRTITPDLIAQMEDGQPKTILLSAIEEVEATPRVSFNRQ